jgi:secreted trypsin-like serine protease
MFDSETNEHDIALIEVKVVFNFTDKSIVPICLPEAIHSNDYPEVGTDVIAVGWGRTQASNQSDTLQQVTLKVVNESTNGCDTVVHNYTLQLCAFASGKGKTCLFNCSFLFIFHLCYVVDTCQGDSGGPLMFFTQSKRWELIGITSEGHKCATKYPGVYTRITAFLKWIQQSISKMSPQSSKYIRVTTWFGDQYEILYSKISTYPSFRYRVKGRHRARTIAE